MFPWLRELFCLKQCASGENRSAELLFVVLNQRKNIRVGQFTAAVQKSEFDGEGGAFDLSAEFFNQFCRGEGRAAGGKKIVANQNTLAGLDGVFMHFERIGAVFERI